MSVNAILTGALSKKYDSKWAFRSCTLAVPDGRLCALVGRTERGSPLYCSWRRVCSNRQMGASKSSVQYQARTHAGWPKSGTSPKTSLFTADELLGMGRHLNPGWDDPLARRRLTDLGLPLDKPVGLLSGGERAQVAHWPWPWASTLACCCWTSRWPASTRWPGATSWPLWPPPVPNPISLLCSRPTWSPTSSASVTT